MELILSPSTWFNTQTLTHILMWVSLTFYLVCFFPQIMTNYRQKSGKGISELMLLGYLNAYLFILYYIFFMEMPLAYRIMVPTHAFATCVLVLQRLYYDKTAEVRKYWLLYSANVGLFVLLLPFAFKHQLIVGAAFGWCNFLLSVVNQLPQVIKIYRDKSVAGFNYLFVLFTGLAALVETIVAFSVGLPLQTCFNAVRGVVLALIFTGQFLIYKK